MDEQCVLCGIGAAVRVGGTSFCASCGLSQYSANGTPPKKVKKRSRRAGFYALFSSGILVKTLLGAVAVAAVGGAASTVIQPSEPAVETTVAVATTTTPRAEPVITADTAGVEEAPAEPVTHGEAVAAFVDAMQAWADCVSDAASVHYGGPFNPHAACPDKPRPGDFGINVPGHDEDGPGKSEDAPGHDEDGPGKSEDAPGHDEDGPGKSEDAPGHDEDGPGNSESAPGQSDDGPSNSGTPPGQEKDKDKDVDE